MPDLIFYGDESFGPRRSGSQGCYVVAGYLGSVEVWKAIADEWKAVLDSAPRIGYFHMAECFAAMENRADTISLGQFSDLSARDAKQKLDAVVRVLERYGPSLAAAWSITTWDVFDYALIPHDKQSFGSPYYLGFMGCFQCCLEMVRQIVKPVLPIEFIFDERSDSEKIMKVWNLSKSFEGLPNSPEVAEVLTLMGSIEFTNDKTEIPIQCADLLAWHVRRDYVSPVEDHDRTRPEFERLKTSVNRYCKHLENEMVVRESRTRIWLEMYQNWVSRQID